MLTLNKKFLKTKTLNLSLGTERLHFWRLLWLDFFTFKSLRDFFLLVFLGELQFHIWKTLWQKDKVWYFSSYSICGRPSNNNLFLKFAFVFLSYSSCLWVPHIHLFFQNHLCHELTTFGCQNVQENGHSSVYTWILSTGWWKNRAPVNPDAVFVVGFLCTCLIGGFIYLNRSLYVEPYMLILM
jgi:hypothetical protein